MSYHLAAYTVLVGTTANTDAPALSDDILTIFNNHFLLRKSLSLVRAYGASATLSRVRFDSPTLRFYGNPFIRPLNLGTLPLSNPGIMQIDDRPVMFPANEEIAMQVTSAIAMGTERFTGLIWLQDTKLSPAPGNVYPVRFTSTGAATANAWTTVSYTMDTGLPTGWYDMLMSEVQSTNALAHRWIFDEQELRPGNVGITAITNRLTDFMYDYPLGVMGTFPNTSLPRLQVLANAADAAHEGYMYLVPRGRMAA